MIVKELLDPQSIVVVGGSNDPSKPGGKVLKNIIEGGYEGKLYVVNPKESEVQGIKCYANCSELENVDLAIIAIAAKYIPETMELLSKEKNTKAFIILSAGFSEVGKEGKILEEKVVEIVDNVGGTLIGPNCIGMLTTKYKGVFAGAIPKFDPKGCDCVSASGATMVFILETAIPFGLTFSSIFSVGNSAQIGVEEVLEYWDESFEKGKSSEIKLLYLEKIDKPDLFLKHARSLINKGCRIAAIKAGTTEAGSRAVSSHTGALAGSDLAVDALFKKAGIVRCYSRLELVTVASVFAHKRLNGDRIAIITHAGGPGVLLTDTLTGKGMKVPHISGAVAEDLLSKLNHGSSVANPIDFIATGTAEQLGIILDFVENKFDNIDGAAVIFGTTGMFDVTTVYDVLHEKMNTCKKPIFPIMPSVVQADKEMQRFLSLGGHFYTDEVVFGNALAKVFFTPEPAKEEILPEINKNAIRQIINSAKDGYLSPNDISSLFWAANIPQVKEKTVKSKSEANETALGFGFPLVMKVIGPVHKTDVGGVVLNINDLNNVETSFDKLMNIPGAECVLIQQMISGTEVFIGAKYEPGYGHIILCGLGGVFIEVLKDIAYGLSPLGIDEAIRMIRSLKGYKMIKGIRGKPGVNEEKFAEIITSLSALLIAAPEIRELDINPLLGTPDSVVAVDARIRIEKS